ncbi:MAG: iron-sulfur cluster assembly scaffold protein [Candidatus Omnitrophica bacterium]|nr:iron-sulfur cluster assembly scaffold protein [Candidatus Omnitrophota bacterium]
MHDEDISIYPEHIVNVAKDPKHFGRMNGPTSSAFIKGLCGDEMEFYLVIEDRIIKEVKFHTTGCIATIVCGSVAAQLALGKSIDEALSISPREIIESLHGLPEGHSHCSILAVSTLYRAIADYLLKI